MSLDVELIYESIDESLVRRAIFIREDGRMKEITPEEWNKRNPDREPVTCEVQIRRVWCGNITHNLIPMARAATSYQTLWRPDVLGFDTATKIAPSLKMLCLDLEQNADEYRKHNPDNGWGSYEQLLQFVKEYYEACVLYPHAKISASR